MQKEWYYSLDGVRRGAFTLEEIESLIAQGKLPPKTPIWQVTRGPDTALPAETQLALRVLPDWLEDVRLAIETGPQTREWTTPSQSPDWVADLANVEGRPRSPRGKGGSAEQTRRDPPLPVPRELLPDLPETPRPTPVARSASPVPVAQPARPPAPPVSRPRTDTIPVATPVTPPPSPPAATSQAAAPLSLTEAFRRAQFLFSQWLDDDANESHILSATRNLLEQQSAVQAILQLLRPFGSPAIESFWEFATFLLENRKRYHAARKAAPAR